MLSFAREMESNQFDQLYKMMSVINENQYQRRPAYKPYKMDMYQHDMYNSDNKMDDKFKMMMKMMMFKKMRDDMMSYDSMKSQYNNKYGMNEQMDMHKFEKMFDMIKSMKHQEKQYDAPIAARMRSSMVQERMPMVQDFDSFADFFKNSFHSKRAADTDALALNDRLKEKIQHVFEEQ